MKNKYKDVVFQLFPLYETVKAYKKEYIRRDIVAALTVAVIVIPQSMAYAIIAGVNPVYGLYTAIVSTIIASAFGSSNHLIAGPTNAISLLIASSMRDFIGLDNAYQILFLLTFLVGMLQILFGLFKLGKVINYVSHTVIIGFTAGAGVLIALGQLNQLLGISIKNSIQLSTIEKLLYVITHINETNTYALFLGLLTISIIIVCRKINKNLPGSLIGIIIPIFLILWFSLDKYGVKLTGEIPAVLPSFKMITLDIAIVKDIFSSSLAIAIVGLIEAISISKSIATSSKQKINANQEFIGQGMANLVSSFFQCFAGSGSFTRSAVNYYSGAITRLSGILSGVFVAISLIFLAPYAQFIPMPCLAGVILVVAYNMVNKKEFKRISTINKSDGIVMWVTFIATVLMPDLERAIYIGIIISIVLYLKESNQVPVKILVKSKQKDNCINEYDYDYIDEKVDILIIQLSGNLYFGSAYDLENKLGSLIDKAKVIIIRMKNIERIDITCMDVLKTFMLSIKENNGNIILEGVTPGLMKSLINAQIDNIIGGENILLSEDEVFASLNKSLELANKFYELETKNSFIEK